MFRLGTALVALLSISNFSFATQDAISRMFKSNMVFSTCTATEPSDIYASDPYNRGYIPSTAFAPAFAIRRYVAEKTNFKNNDYAVASAKVTILEGPSHGELKFGGHDPDHGDGYEYKSNPGFLGQDKVVSLVELHGKSHKVITTILVVHPIGEDMCFEQKRIK